MRPDSPTERRDGAADSAPGRITMIEVVSYTAIVALVGALASGVFDAMVPW